MSSKAMAAACPPGKKAAYVGGKKHCVSPAQYNAIRHPGGGSATMGVSGMKALLSGASKGRRGGNRGGGSRYGMQGPGNQYFPSPLDNQPQYDGGDDGGYGVTVNQQYYPSPLDMMGGQIPDMGADGMGDDSEYGGE